MWFRFVVSLSLVACGGSSSTNTDGHPVDMRPIDVGMYDFGCATGSPCTLNQVCCAMPGATTTFGCTMPSACPAADQIKCDGPDECGGSTPTCCGVYMADGTGSYPNCGIATLGTSCTATASCTTHIGQSCTDTSKVQICHMNAECTDPTNNQCCTFTTSGGGMLTFCIDSFTAGAAGATCHP